METRIFKLIQDNKLHIQAGLNGNYYVFSKDKKKVEKACKIINKAISSIYYRHEHGCWAIRIVSKTTQKKLKEAMTKGEL